MPSGLQRVRLEAAHLGEDKDAAPSSIPQGKGYLVQNYLTGERGRIRQRGPISAAAIAHGAITRAVAGYAAGNDKALLGYVDLMQNTRKVERHVAPRAGATAAELAKAVAGAGAGKLVDLKANSVANVTLVRNESPFRRWARVGRFAYGFVIDSDDDTDGSTIGINDSGGKERITRMARWQVDSPSTAPVVYWCGPYGGQDMRFYYNKLFALGGRQPETGGNIIESNVVWYTREWKANHHFYGFSPLDDSQNVTPAASGTNFWPGNVPLVGVSGNCFQGASSPSAMWFDPDDQTSANRLNLPGDEADYGVSFAYVGRNLAILKRRSVIFLVGGDPDTWQLRTAVQGVGCLDPRSIVEANEGAYFASQQGFMYFDGVQLHNTSVGVQRTLLDALHNAVGDESDPGGFAVGERLDRDYIFLTIGRYYWSADGIADPAAPDVFFAGLYHIPSNSWTTFKTGLFSVTDNAPQYALRTENRNALIGHLNAYVATNVVQPDRAAEADRGKDTGSTNIETKWHSRTVELAMPFERAAIKRVIVDYNWIKDGAATPDTAPFDGPTVTLCDATGTPYGGDSTFTLPYGVDDGREVQRQRITRDVNIEASEVQVRIEYSGAATALVQCDIQDVWVEYQTAHERRGVV